MAYMPIRDILYIYIPWALYKKEKFVVKIIEHSFSRDYVSSYPSVIP